MRIALITKQIGHYHHARFCSAASTLDDFHVVAVTLQAAFKEFEADLGNAYPVTRLYADLDNYKAAVAAGEMDVTMADALDKIAPDVVVVSGWAMPETYAGIKWARANGKGLVTMSESQAHDAARSPIRELIKSRIVKLCDAALVGADPHAAYATQLGIPRSNIHLGYNAVGNDVFAAGADASRADAAAMRERYGLPASYLLASGRFIRKKNFPALIRAYGQARATAPEAPDLVILGGGDEKPALEGAIESTGVPGHVHLPGYRGIDTLPAFYGLAEGFAHVSLVEQWGLVVNEAAAAGLPLIVSRPCGVASALVDESRNGFLVDPTSENDMARAIYSLFTLSPAARAEMGAESRRIVADWGPTRYAAGLKAACESALAAPARRIAPWDAAILRTLSKRLIATVA